MSDLSLFLLTHIFKAAGKLFKWNQHKMFYSAHICEL